jgi:anaerobic ribonucleoside-triphosphate reductase activating protein
MLIHNKLESSTVNGPGNRAVIWFQGCSLGCKGCWNPETHSFDNLLETSIYEVEDWLCNLPDIEGVTFSGGEPMQQASSLLILMARVRARNPQLSFGMYTGYSQKELDLGSFKWKSMFDAEWKKGSKELWTEVKGYLDFAVLGRYNQLVRVTDNSLPLIGSTNQELVFFTERYKPSDLEAGYEVHIPADGSTVSMTGFPVGVIE